MTQIKNDLVQHREISHRSDSSRTHIYLGLVGIDMRHSTTLLSDSRSHAIARGRVASTLFGTCKNRTKSPLGRRVAPVDAAVEIHDRIGSALRSVKGKSIQPLHRGMFKFDTKTQNPKPKRWSATGGVVRRIMASFLGRRTSRLGILRPYQFSDQACAQLPDLSTWSLSHSDESPLSAPCPYLAHNARANRVRASHGGRCLKSLVCMSVVCLSCLCMSVTVNPSMSLSMCPCVCRVLSMPMPMRLSVLCCRVCPVCLVCPLCDCVPCEYRHGRQPRFEAVSAPKCG